MENPFPDPKPSEAGLNRKRRRERNGADVAEASATERSAVSFDEGQAKKSARGMPWHQEPKKDVTSCDKLRGAANKR